MKSINHIGFAPASLPLSADDVVEFHAARILLWPVPGLDDTDLSEPGPALELHRA